MDRCHLIRIRRKIRLIAVAHSTPPARRVAAEPYSTPSALLAGVLNDPVFARICEKFLPGRAHAAPALTVVLMGQARRQQANKRSE